MTCKLADNIVDSIGAWVGDMATTNQLLQTTLVWRELKVVSVEMVEK